MPLQYVFVYAFSHPTKVLITHWVSQSRQEEFSSVKAHLWHSSSCHCSQSCSVVNHILHKAMWAQGSRSFHWGRVSSPYISELGDPSSYLRFLFSRCFIALFFFFFLLVFYAVHSVISVHLHSWSMNHWQIEQSMKRRTWKMFWLPSIVVKMTAKCWSCPEEMFGSSLIPKGEAEEC